MQETSKILNNEDHNYNTHQNNSTCNLQKIFEILLGEHWGNFLRFIISLISLMIYGEIDSVHKFNVYNNYLKNCPFKENPTQLKFKSTD